MQRIAEFERVSFTQFQTDAVRCGVAPAQDAFLALYNQIKLPERATAQSAGYDFFAPHAFALAPREGITIPTGIRAKITPGWWLAILPRSGQGFRYRIQLDNTVGVIDADYYNADNEGHILIKLTSDCHTDTRLKLTAGQGFAQGIFLSHGITESDTADLKRTGGFGSTGV